MRATHVTIIIAIGSVVLSGSTVVRADDGSPSQTAPAPVQTSGDAAKDNVKKEPPATPADAPSAASITVIDSGYARGILGRDVRSPTDENMGRIADVIVDRGGQVRAAVIDFGGFLGVGSRKIAVDWNALRFSNVANKGESITLELTRDQVKAAPEYKEDQPIVVLGASGKLTPIRFRPAAKDR